MKSTTRPARGGLSRLAGVSAAVLMMWASASPSHAGFAIGPRFGTTGIGADLTLPLAGTLNLRAIGSFGELTYKPTIDDIRYEFNLNTETLGAVLDWHPGDAAFRFSIGAFWNGIGANGNARLSDNTVIGNRTYTPEEIGILTGDISMPSTCGYFGIGFGNAVKGGRVTFSLDLGVLMGIQDGSADLAANSGLLAHDAQLQRDLAIEEENIMNGTGNLRFYPVLTLGLAVRFW